MRSGRGWRAKTVDGGENSPAVPEKTEAAQYERPAGPEYKTAAREPKEKTPKRRVSRAVCFLAGLLAGAAIAGTIAFFTGGGRRPQGWGQSRW